MAETFETRREMQLNVSADQAWEFLSNIGNAMTVNQFHVGLDCDPARDFRDPKVGLDVPIIHEIYGKRHVRLGKITQYGDYEICLGRNVSPIRTPKTRSRTAKVGKSKRSDPTRACCGTAYADGRCTRSLRSSVRSCGISGCR